VSHETLQALRSVLAVLRDDRQALRAPAPSVSRLDPLIARVAEMGVTAHVEHCGAARPLPPGVDLAAYRILQEALTNVARHSRATAARVQLSYGDADLVVQVDDDGQLWSQFTPGTGITGMTERVTALGGKFQAGPRPEGGFRVRACLPLGEMR
jgi:signal transduction histidine kinase